MANKNIENNTKSCVNKGYYYIFIISVLWVASSYGLFTKESRIITEGIISSALLEILYIILNSIWIILIYRWSFKNKKPNFIFDYFEQRDEKHRKEKMVNEFNRIFEEEDKSALKMAYINNSIEKLNSVKKEFMPEALWQLLSWVDEDDRTKQYIISRLIDIYNKRKDDASKKAILNIICKYYRSM